MQVVDANDRRCHFLAVSIARSDRTVETVIQQSGECVAAARCRMKRVTAELARTLSSTDACCDGVRNGETRVLAAVQRAVSDILLVTTHTSDQMTASSSEVFKTLPLVVDGPVETTEATANPRPTGLSKRVDELVAKSPTLWNFVLDFRNHGGTFRYGADGQSSDIATNALGKPVLTLDGEARRSPEATLREIAWQLGLSATPPANLGIEVKPGVSQTAMAALVGAKVRADLLGAGVDIGLAHPDGQRYLRIYEQNSRDPRAAYLRLYLAAVTDSLNFAPATMVPK
jgi:hypothetical protein